MNMKRLLIGIICLCFLPNNSYCQLKARVDERFELTSIVFALAGVPEYCQISIPSYKRDIIKELTPYELTEPINYIRELHQFHAIGYNAVSTTAAMLEIKDGKIQLQPQYSIAEISSADKRWTPELFSEYITMLNQFYKDSNFHKFYKNHKKLYDIAEQRMDDILSDMSFDWFESFFGTKLDHDIDVYVSLVNGPSNYAIPNGVLIGLSAGMDGLPITDKYYTTFLIVHEIGHHYTNPMFKTWWPQLENAANIIYPHVQEQMLKNAYGDAQSTMCEWLNNLFALMYMKDTNNSAFPIFVRSRIDKGFIWMQRSIEFMENFYTYRNHYLYINDFMPQIVSFANYTANNFNFVIQEYETRNPYITNIFPAADSDITNFDEIVITFSEPMLGSWGFNGSGIKNSTVLCLPIQEVVWSDDLKQVRLLLDKSSYMPNQTYSIQLVPRAFQSSRCFPMNSSNNILTFNTIQK